VVENLRCDFLLYYVESLFKFLYTGYIEERPRAILVFSGSPLPVHTCRKVCQSFSFISCWEELDIPFDKRYNHPAALSTFSYGAKRLELLKTSFYWQRLLMKRNSFIYVFKFIQVVQVINYYHNLKSYPRILRCFG
jgi:hypothetical protein